MTLNLFIKGMGHSHPKNIITNQILTDLNIGTNNDWIIERVGIRERRSILPIDYILSTKNENVLEGLKFVDNATRELIDDCYKNLISSLGEDIKNKIDLVVAGGSGPTRLAPVDSATFANILGINVPCVDFNSACTSWAAGLHFIKQLSQYKNILLINCETPTSRISYADRKNCVLVGDCCVMTYLTREDGHFIIDETIFDSNPSGCNKVIVPNNDFFNQDGSAVQKFAITQMSNLYKSLVINDDNSTFIGHQANKLALNSIVERCDIKNHLSNIEYYGNSFAAGGPSVLSQNFNKIETNYVIMAMVGSGLSWGGIRLIRKNS